MRIAFVVSDLSYPPREGLHQQTLVTASLIAGAGREVDIFGFVRDPARLNRDALLADLGLTFADEPIPTRMPQLARALLNQFLPNAFLGPRIAALRAQLAKYDVVHLENISACALASRDIAGKSIIGLIDPGTLRWKRLATHSYGPVARIKARVFFALHNLLEARLLSRRTYAHVVSAEDAVYLRRRRPQAVVKAVPVSLPLDIVEEAARERTIKKAQSAVVFLDLRQPHLRASLEWFVEAVLRPRADDFAKFTFTVMGRVEPDSGLLDLCRGLPVEFLSWVEDYKVVLKSASVVVTPDRAGTGLKNRVIQSMGLGCAVIGTSVAFEGIAATNCVNAVITDDPGAMAAALLSLMVDEDARRGLAAEAMSFVMREFHPDKVRALWRALQDEIQGQRN